MARTKETTINGVEYRFQSISPRAYCELNDRAGHGDSRNTTLFIDEILKNVVIKPAAVKMKGIDYFDDCDDIDTLNTVFGEAHSFLKEPVKRDGGAKEGEK